MLSQRIFLITCNVLNDYPVFISSMAEKDVEVCICHPTSLQEQLSDLLTIDFVFFAPDITITTAFTILDFFESKSIKAFTTVCFEGDIDTGMLVEYAERVNHFIADLHNERVIKKKLSNLLSIQKLRNEKARLKELENTLEEESAKLVEVNVNNVKLIAEINEKTKLIDIARKDIQNLLDNLTQGFFTINRNGTIQKGFSKVVESLFEMSPLEHTFAELLHMNTEQEKDLVDWLELLFDEFIPYKDLIELAPHILTWNNKYISLEYQPIRNENRIIEKLIVIATDKTREKEFEVEAKRKEDFIAMILSVVKDRNAYRDFCEEAYVILDQLHKELNLTDSQTLDIGLVFRLIHTLKGNAASFHFADTKEIAHNLESKLSAIREHNQKSDALPTERLDEFRKEYDELRSMFLQTQNKIATLHLAISKSKR